MTLEIPTFSAAIPALASGRRLLRNDVFELLLERILTGGFAPGERLKDADLTSWLGVSRTPVREALSKLAVVGLIKTAPNRFTVVAPILDEEVAGALAVLRRLYPDAVREAVETFGDQAELELTVLAARFERDADVCPFETFRRLMLVVLSSLPNQVLAETVETVHLRVIRYLYLTPGSERVLSRPRVLAFGRALCARDERAIATVQEVLSSTLQLLSSGAVPAE